MTVSPVLAQAHPNNRNVEGFLTGGGQITAGDYKVSFAGNVGSSLVGHWQTNFHNVSEDSLDGARFHSTSVILLAYYYDSTPMPSPADANVVHIIAEGMLNGEDGYTLNVWLADPGEPGKMIDAIWMQLSDGWGRTISYTAGLPRKRPRCNVTDCRQLPDTLIKA